MIDFEKEWLARERIAELRRQAEQERLARRSREPGAARRPWRARVAIAIVRRLAGAAEAS